MLTLFWLLKPTSFVFGILYIKDRFPYFLNIVFKGIKVNKLLGTDVDGVDIFFIFLNF